MDFALNTMPVLEQLYEASLMPELGWFKAAGLKKLEQDEWADASHHRGCLLRQLAYEWAVDSGQVDLNKTFNRETISIDHTYFWSALVDITRWCKLEVSEPLATTKSRIRRMKPWPTQRLKLVERTDWKPLKLHYDPQKNHIRIEAWETTPSTTLDSFGVGDVWFRIAKADYDEKIRGDMNQSLKAFGYLIRWRKRRLREIVARQKLKLTDEQTSKLNAYLSESTAEIIESVPQMVDQHVRKLKKKADALKMPFDWFDAANKAAIRGVDGIRSVIHKIENPPEPLNKIGEPSYGVPVFISYARSDKRWLDRLVEALALRIRGRAVDVWYDLKTRPGQKWREEIDKAMATAKVAVLLVSPRFFSSEFIANEELPYLIEQAKKRNLDICWVALSHSDYGESELKDFQAVNNPSRPLMSFTSTVAKDRELVNIVKEIAARAAARKIRDS